jgi:hypothetical protein
MSIQFEHFVGKTINRALINPDHTIMFWQVDNVWYRIVAEGDCCSNSWYEHCDGGDVLQDATLSSFEDIARDGEERGEYECIRINILKFKTSKGHCTIEFRNSSNGYYSGWAEITESVCVELNQLLNSGEYPKLTVMDDF